MSKGYIVIAQNSKHNYIEMAYALALSLKATQSEVSDLAIIVNSRADIPAMKRNVFSHIIELPRDDATESEWKIDNKWMYYNLTPFDETVVLDADMLFTSDVSYWWDIMSQKDIWFTTEPKTYRNEAISSDAYRKVFTANSLPSVYTAFMYFKKSAFSTEFFEIVREIFYNWQDFYYEFLDDHRPKQLSGDVAYALAVKILDVASETTDSLGIPTFVHMKSKVQNVSSRFISEEWIEHIPSYLTQEAGIKIGNFEQYLPFHYHIKEWLTPEIINKLEKANGIN